MEVLREMTKRAFYWVRSKAAQRAERAKLHRVTKIFEKIYIFFNIYTSADLINGFNAAS